MLTMLTMLNKLIAIQRREGWRDREMAARLRCSRSAWTMMRNGTLPFSERAQLAAVRAFPELLGDLVMSVSQSRHEAA